MKQCQKEKADMKRNKPKLFIQISSTGVMKSWGQYKRVNDGER